jgi:hypothetical protein
MTRLQELAVSLAPLADELGELELELAPLKGKIARADAIRRVLREAYADLPANGSYQVYGQRYAAMIGPKGAQTTVNTQRLFNLIGAEKFLDLATVTVKNVERCPVEIRGQVVSVDMAGTRSLSVIPSSPGVRKRRAA